MLCRILPFLRQNDLFKVPLNNLSNSVANLNSEEPYSDFKNVLLYYALLDYCSYAIIA